jgi:hypothetical protein
VIGPEFGLVAPLVPVEAVGHGFGGLAGSSARGQEVADDHLLDFADLAAGHEVAGVDVDGHGALLGAGLEDALVAADGAGEDAALVDGEGEGLFGVDVEPGLEGVDGDEHAGVGGGFDEDGVELLLLEHAAIVVGYFVQVSPWGWSLAASARRGWKQSAMAAMRA